MTLMYVQLIVKGFYFKNKLLQLISKHIIKLSAIIICHFTKKNKDKYVYKKQGNNKKNIFDGKYL